MANQLTPRQLRFVEEFVLSGNAAEAARKAGYSTNGAKVTGCRLLTNPNLQAAIAHTQQTHKATLDIRKEQVIAAILSAVDTARTQENPTAMISGLREIGRLCGFYEAEIAKTPISEEAERLRHGISTMSDAELLAIATAQRTVG